MTRQLRPAAALMLVALLAAGCSDAPAGTAGPGASATGNGVRAQAMTFSACMREHGVKEFPDPGASGELTIDGIANEAGIDTAAAAFTQALDACEDLQPAGFTGERRDAEEQRSALAFARCMREKGVADFPDPAPDAPLVDTNLIPSSDGEAGMSRLNAAMETCGDEVADLVRNR